MAADLRVGRFCNLGSCLGLGLLLSLSLVSPVDAAVSPHLKLYSHPTQPGPLPLPSGSFIASGRWSESQAPLIALTEQDPNQSPPRSQLLYGQGRYGEALVQLEQELLGLDGRSMEKAAALGNLALLHQRLGDQAQAIASVAQGLALAESLGDRSRVTAELLLLQGQLELDQGQSEQALSRWEAAEAIYAALKSDDVIAASAGVTRSRIVQAQALQRLGFYRRALDRLTDLGDRFVDQPNSPEKVRQLRALGDALQLLGDGRQAEPQLMAAAELAELLNLADERAAISLSLGNGAAAQTEGSDTAARERQIAKALKYYAEAANSADPQLALLAQVNQLSLLRDDKTKAENLKEDYTALRNQLIPAIQQRLSQGSHRDARLKFGSILTQLPDQQQLAQQVLRQALNQAEVFEDRRSQSYALGYLARLAQQQGDRSEALDLTRQALSQAQAANAPEIAYQWQWRLGQLLKQEGDLEAAIVAYDGAIANLEILRGDLTAVNRDVQFSFRESVEPVYRESVGLMLEAAPEDQKSLDKARQRIEALQLAELDNFFREACVDARSVAIDEVVDQDNPTAAVIYPIVLDDRMEVIVKVPQQDLRRYSIDQSSEKVEAVASELQAALLETDQTFEVKELSQQLYEWLIDPLESQLDSTVIASKDGPTGLPSTPVDTLVFVLDGPLRSLPMAALYDGEQYLVEKYAVALSLGLQLLDPRPLDSQELGVLAAGLADVPEKYRPLQSLPKVSDELALISGTLAQGKGQMKQLLDQDFTKAQLAASVQDNPFNVLHLATHGQFSSRAEDTFVLAADGRINVNQFDDLLRQRETSQDIPIELLVLSACQTASGDDRATLGLAGVAVRAGARSTLASLWNIGDESTSILIGEFYRELAEGDVTKAEALRRAQVTLLRDYPNHAKPTSWAPYVLVGNWL